MRFFEEIQVITRIVTELLQVNHDIHLIKVKCTFIGWPLGGSVANFYTNSCILLYSFFPLCKKLNFIIN